jgi:hypothetical protein
MSGVAHAEFCPARSNGGGGRADPVQHSFDLLWALLYPRGENFDNLANDN